MKRTKPTIVDLSTDVPEGLLRRAEAKRLSDDDCEKLKVLKVLAESYVHLLDLLKDKNVWSCCWCCPWVWPRYVWNRLSMFPRARVRKSGWLFACAGGAYARTATSI